MKATFENSVNVLLQAYLNDTLEHGNCYACAVGNLVAHANNYHYTGCIDSSKRLALKENSGRYYGEGVGGDWFIVVDQINGGDGSRYKLEIDSIGYSDAEVILIERAFESAEYSHNEDQFMFNGLMAVVDVLAEIHNVDLSVREEIKKPFIEQYSVITKP